LETDADYASKVGARSVTDEQRELITRLFRLARGSALDAEATLSELASRLDAIA